MTQEKLVPKLRFKEFTEEWEKIFLNKLLTFKNGFNASKEKYGSGTKFINVSDILDNYFITYDNILESVEVNEKEFENYIVEYGDIVFQRSSETREEVGTANVYLSKKPCVYGGFVIRGKKKGNYNPFFLKELLLSTSVRKEITSWSGGSTRYNIGQESLNKISILLPSLKEQNLISHYICSINKKIELLKTKQNEYQMFKKYLLQNIFSQKLRFNNFEEEWVEYSLGKIGTTYGGLSGLTKDDFGKGNSLFIPYKNVFDNNIINTAFLESVELNNKQQNQVQKGDLFFTGSSETPEEVGMASVLNEEVSNCYLNSFCFGYRLNEPSKFNSEFLAYYLRSPLLRNKLKILAQGSTRFNISKKELMKLKLDIPNLNEQNKIVKVFNALNLKLSNNVKQISHMEEFKKGLLQSMFV